MKRILPPLLLGLGMAAALLLGRELGGGDAGAVILGVAIGTAASVPTSVLLVNLLRRERRQWAALAAEPAGQASVCVNCGSANLNRATCECCDFPLAGAALIDALCADCRQLRDEIRRLQAVGYDDRRPPLAPPEAMTWH